jgi:hypothetical protein
MVNLEGFKAESFKGVIDNIEEMLLKDYLETDDKIQAFKDGMTLFPKDLKTARQKEDYKDARMNSTILAITYSVTLNDVKKSNSEFFNIPQITGWGRSKLRDLREKNDLPYSQDTKEWIGKTVTVLINKEGYLRLLPDK